MLKKKKNNFYSNYRFYIVIIKIRGENSRICCLSKPRSGEHIISKQ